MFHPYYRSAEISKYLSFYHTLYCILRNENKLVLSHNDLSVWNILDDEKKGIFQVIDFEYAAYNIPYWDIFNFLRDLTGEDFQLTFNLIKETYHLDLSFMYQMLFLTSFYAYTWAVFMYLKEGWNELKEYLLKQQKNFILFYDKVFHSSKF
uniref:phosphotransferase n=1 Tax=Ureaplasma canigenitalium TaxID=42092 RepID=UPI001FE142CF